MKNILPVLIAIALLPAACVPKKRMQELQNRYATLEASNSRTAADLAKTQASLGACEAERGRLEKELENLKSTNFKLLNSMTEMATLSQKEAQNLQLSLEKIKEKDLQIKSLNEAINRKDSITIALVTSIKKAVGTEDKDIEVNVEKGVVLISISDKFLFQSGSYIISPRANEVLRKVSLVLKDKPTFEVLIEGHTDNVPFKKGELIDNWDLSVKRATSLARTLVQQFGIEPGRLIPAGRGPYVPIASNDTAEGKAANRRTRVIIMPKIDEFYGMIEKGMKGQE